MASGKTIQVYYDYAAGKSMPVPRDVREKLLSDSEAPASGRPIS